MKNNSLDIISFALIALFLFFQLNGLILNNTLLLKFTFIYWIGMLFISIRSIISNQYHFPKNSNISRPLVVLVVYMFVMSFSYIALENGLIAKLATGISVVLPVFLFSFLYSLSKRLNDDRTVLKILFWMVIGLSISIAFDTNNRLENSLLNVEIKNVSYFVLYLLPFILCIKEKNLRNIGIVVIFLSVVISFKRGGLIAITLAVIIYFFFKNFVLGKIKMKKIINYVIILLAFYSIILFVNNFSNNFLFERMMEMENDGGSGRIDVYKYTIQIIFDSDIIDLVLGHGYNKVGIDSEMGLSAHNDFLEVLYDFGIVGLIMYLFLHINIIRLIVKLSKQQSFYAAPLASSYIIFLVASFVSIIMVRPYYLIIFSMFWGYVLGITNNKKLKKQKE